MTEFTDRDVEIAEENLARDRNRVGRPATGQNTKVIRVPKDFDRSLAIKLYYDWYPVIQEYADEAAVNTKAVRWERLIKLLEELGEM